VLASWLFAVPDRARAAELEYRDFAVTIDGKPAGAYHLTIARQNDGAFTVEAQARINLTYYVVYHYSYQLHDAEVWKDGRLRRLESSGNDNGRPLSVIAVTDGSQLLVNVNGRQERMGPDTWTSIYWHLPPPGLRDKMIVIMDADTGHALKGNLRYMGPSPVKVAGRAWNCAHYQIPELGVDLWFDGQERLVRQHYVEDHRHVAIDLTGIRR
jgi:hypothetical protein